MCTACSPRGTRATPAADAPWRSDFNITDKTIYSIETLTYLFLKGILSAYYLHCYVADIVDIYFFTILLLYEFCIISL